VRLVGRQKQGRTVHYHTIDPRLPALCELMCTSLVEQARRLPVQPTRARAG
jgi:hypothetical protein